MKQLIDLPRMLRPGDLHSVLGMPRQKADDLLKHGAIIPHRIVNKGIRYWIGYDLTMYLEGKYRFEVARDLGLIYKGPTDYTIPDRPGINPNPTCWHWNLEVPRVEAWQRLVAAIKGAAA